MKDKIVFLGTGGGGSMVSYQKCATAGTWWNIGGIDFFLDPGPGAMWHLNQFNLKPNRLKAIFVSHLHLDHTSDLDALVDAVYYLNNSRGEETGVNKDFTVFLPSDVLKENIFKKYHCHFPKKIVQLKENKEYILEGLRFKTTKRLREKPYYFDQKIDEFGFLFKNRKYKAMYLPETYYQEKMLEKYKPDYLILNFMNVLQEGFEEIKKNILTIEPSLVILRHWSMRAWKYGIEKIAKKVEKMANLPVLAAKDGDIFDLRKGKMVK